MITRDESTRAAKIEKRNVVYPDAPRRSERAGVGGDADGVHPTGVEDQGGLPQREASTLQEHANAGTVRDGIHRRQARRAVAVNNPGIQIHVPESVRRANEKASP